eukprot:m.160225 g.160225  ORF g.160225 m.160225 type:complete len:83 (-) comp24815_c0_seq7:68-316(-)
MDEVVEGPCKVVDYILEKNKADSISTLVTKWEEDVPSCWSDSKNSPLFLGEYSIPSMVRREHRVSVIVCIVCQEETRNILSS